MKPISSKSNVEGQNQRKKTYIQKQKQKNQRKKKNLIAMNSIL